MNKCCDTNMEFSKRDIILIVGLVLFMIGLIPFTTPIYAIVIVTIMYVGIKVFVEKKNKMIRDDIGPEGICMDCGSKIRKGKCTNLECRQKDLDTK